MGRNKLSWRGFVAQTGKGLLRSKISWNFQSYVSLGRTGPVICNVNGGSDKNNDALFASAINVNPARAGCLISIRTREILSETAIKLQIYPMEFPVLWTIFTISWPYQTRFQEFLSISNSRLELD